MLRAKKARFECSYGCCREYRNKKCGSYRQRDKNNWKKEARNGLA